MTPDQVEHKTGCSVRVIATDPEHDWLSCQIGKWGSKSVKTSVMRSISVPVFALLAYGSSWETAYAMFLKR